MSHDNLKDNNIKSDRNIIDKAVVGNIPLKTVSNLKQKCYSYSPILASAIIGIKNTAAAVAPGSQKVFWSDIDTQENYLNTKPTNYVIICKPGLGAFTFGEDLSKKLKCVHLCPYNILLDEIKQNTSTGKCIDFNLRHNNVICFNIILSILQRKIKSAVIQHRGYIISGFPLISAIEDTLLYIHSLYSEQSIGIIQELITELLSSVGKKNKSVEIRGELSSININEEIIEEENELNNFDENRHENSLLEMPIFILDPLSDIIQRNNTCLKSIEFALLTQLNEIFDSSNKPDFVIYVTCSDKDVISIKSKKYFNYEAEKPKKYLFSQSLNNLDNTWQNKYDIEVIEVQSEKKYLKYNCCQPFDFNVAAKQQLCNYTNYLLPTIEKTIKQFNPKYVMKVDGRISSEVILTEIEQKLHLMPIHRVVIPQPIFTKDISEIPENYEDFWNYIAKKNIIETEFFKMNRSPSLWNIRCPIELKRGKLVEGKIKYAVTFLKHVYLLYSYESMKLFCANPRPFIKLKFLEPTCRMIILGSKLFGKIMPKQCLSWIFDAQVISYSDIEDKIMTTKKQILAENIFKVILDSVVISRHESWEEMESLRKNNLDKWLNKTYNDLKYYLSLNDYEVELDIDKLSNIKEKLSNIICLDDTDYCETILTDKNILLAYAPKELLTSNNKPDLPQLEDYDVVQAITSYITDNELQAEIEPTYQEVIDDLQILIEEIDKEAQLSSSYEKMYGKWIIDDFPTLPEVWSLLHEIDMIPDYIIALLDSKEITPDTFKLYKYVSATKKDDYETYEQIEDPLVCIKLSGTKPEPISRQDCVKNIVNKILEECIIYEDESEGMASFIDAVEIYRLHLDNIRTIVKDNRKCIIDIDIQDKNDIIIMEEILLHIRKAYNISCLSNEDVDLDDNDTQIFGDTNIYCPVAFYDYNILREGKQIYSLKFNNKTQNFCTEQCMLLFTKDPIKYQAYNFPYKKLPPLRICIIGCIGSGKTTLARRISKELGLLYISFTDIVNELLTPKHFKRIGRQYENTFDNGSKSELIEEMTDAENDMLINEISFRKHVYNYIENGLPLPSYFLRKLLSIIWFKYPYLDTGFVLDGFPNLTNDVEDMIATFCIPDLIIDIESNSEVIAERLLPQMLQNWKKQMDEAKKVANEQLQKNRSLWLKKITQKIVIQIIIDELINDVFPIVDTNVVIPSNENLVVDGHTTDYFVTNNTVINLYQKYIEKNPEPIDQRIWETQEEYMEKIEATLERIYTTNDENMISLKDTINDNNIKSYTINGLQSIEKIYKSALSTLKNVRKRNESFFEQTFLVENNVAEIMLNEGLVLLSHFHRMCPVHISKNSNSLHNTFYINGNLNFPVVHRNYLYFIKGKVNLNAFRSNPLLYISNQNIYEFLEYPLRLSIIGKPKTGKSTLMRKFIDLFGLLPISRGMAIRYVIKNMSWTELGKTVIKILNDGNTLNVYFTMQCVQAAAINFRTICYGFVFDGFPQNSLEYQELVNLGLDPLITININCNNYKIDSNITNEANFDIIKEHPPYSVQFIKTRLKTWNGIEINKCFNNSILNVVPIDGNESKWECWRIAKMAIELLVKKIRFYLKGLQNTEVAIRAGIMCISKLNYMQRMSQFKNFCPLCLKNNVIRHSDWPCDRLGIIQYKNLYYWVCPDHLEIILNNPSFLNQQALSIPEIAVAISHLDLNNIYENGVCIVTYARNLPSLNIQRGKKEYVAGYRKKHYMFCSFDCMKEFMETPHLYYNIKVFNDNNIQQKIFLKDLPNLGYLEQTIANILTKACCYVNAIRPKYPGLSVEMSAFILLALYLKIHNPLINQSFISLYKKTLDIFEYRCKLINKIGLQLRSLDNPLSNYPPCKSNVAFGDNASVTASFSEDSFKF